MSDNVPKDVREKITSKANEIEKEVTAFLEKYGNSRSVVAAGKELMPILKKVGELEKLFHSPKCKHQHNYELFTKPCLENNAPAYIEFCVAEDGGLLKIVNRPVGSTMHVGGNAMMPTGPMMVREEARKRTNLWELSNTYGVTPKNIAEILQQQVFQMAVYGMITQYGADA